MAWYTRLLKDFTLTAPTSEFMRWLNGGSEESAQAITARSGVQWYGAQIYVKRCVDIQADALTQATWAAYRDSDKKKRITKHPALDALNNPNPHQDRTYFIRAIYAWLRLHGNAYVYNAGSNAAPELYLLPGDRTHPIPGKDGWPAYYILKNGAKEIRYELDEITHIKRFNPLSGLVGISDIEALREDLQIGGLSRRQRRTFWLNDASPAGILSTDQHVTDEEATRQVRRWVKLFRGPDKAGKTAYLSGGTKYQQVGIAPKDAQWLQQHDVEAKDICIGLGVPLVLLDGSSANFATALEAKRTLWHETIIPFGDLICAALSAAPWAQGVTLGFDTSLVEALATDTAAEREDALALFAGGLITLNRARQKVDEPPLPNGDLFAVPSNVTLVPANELGVKPEPPAPAPPQEDPNEPPQDGNTDGAAGQSGDAAGDADAAPAGGSAAGGDAPAKSLADPITGDTIRLFAQLGSGDALQAPGDDPGRTPELAPGQVEHSLSLTPRRRLCRIYATEEPA